jgi:HD-GYP domain-containing protein (c-di-GMP phosphodiesterase class II)
MLGHGLTTPGVFNRPMNDWVSRLPYIGMCGLAVCLFGAGRSASWGLNRFIARRPTLSIFVPTAAITALVVAVSVNPLLLGGGRPYPWEENAFDVVSIVAVVLLLLVIRTHWMRWHLGYDVVQFAIVLAAASAIAAVIAFEHGKFGQISWWDYHGYLIAGFGGAIYAVFRGRSDERTLTDILGAAFVDDPFDQIVSGYPEALRSLVHAVEIKDAYTHGHSQRTARLSVELGLSMGLSSDRLRVIARGAYLHDVGKIGIPDAILNKPGKLTNDEWSVIHTHPQLGYELASTSPSLKEALPVILHHHERVDGCGYPHGLVGDDIPLEARVVAVADVWDALTSDRAYRRGWAPDMALAHILAGSGTHFDPIVVKAFTRLVGRWGVRSGQPGGAATIAWQAAETCHEVDQEEPALV